MRTKEFTVIVGRKESKGYNSREFRLSRTFELGEEEEVSDGEIQGLTAELSRIVDELHDQQAQNQQHKTWPKPPTARKD